MCIYIGAEFTAPKHHFASSLDMIIMHHLKTLFSIFIFHITPGRNGNHLNTAVFSFPALNEALNDVGVLF